MQWQEQLNALLERVSVPNSIWSLLFSSLILIVAIVIARSVLRRVVMRAIQSAELRRRWLIQLRNAWLILLVLGMVLIWADELRTLALALVAIAVAFVVATKELILCVIGSVVKGGAKSFDIGDRIQIKDFRGDVIDLTLLATTILEVGPGKLHHQRTGRMTVIPNAIFVSEPVINESYTQDYVLHVFTIPFKREENWRLAQHAVLTIANKHCESYINDARRYMKKLLDDRGLDIPSIEPRVSIQVPTAGELHLIVRIPTLAARRSAVEQAILAELFNEYDFSNKKPTEVASD